MAPVHEHGLGYRDGEVEDRLETARVGHSTEHRNRLKRGVYRLGSGRA